MNTPHIVLVVLPILDPDAVALGLTEPDTCQRCADHDPRDRRDHGHIPDSLSHTERP